MVNCCRSGLKSITADIPWLDNGMTKALIYQSSTLETLRLQFYDQQSSMAPTRNIDSLCMILQRCVRLRHLSLEFTPYPLANEEMIQLFIQPWACIYLETLALEDVIMAAPNQVSRLATVFETTGALHRPVPSLSTVSTQGSEGLELNVNGNDIDNDGGRVARSLYSSLSPSPSARQLLFDQARRLKKLHKLSLNHVTYAVENLASPPSAKMPSSTGSKDSLEDPGAGFGNWANSK